MSLALPPLEKSKTAPAATDGPSVLLRDRGFLAIIVASALIQSSHAAYYIFASIAWQQSGFGGLTIAGLWALGVLAEIVLFALSPRFTLPPAVLVVISALSAVVRWVITAQDPPIPILAIVQLGHGLTFGLTQVGIMGLMVHHVPGHVMARGQGYLAACSGIVASIVYAASGSIYAHYGQGIYYVMAAMAASGGLVILAGAGSRWPISPRAPLPGDRRDCRHSASRRRGRAPAIRDRRDRRSGPAARAASPAPSPAKSRPCSRS